MTTQKYNRVSSRSEQMKRELIGLVIGATLLMTGMAVLFSQVISADSHASAMFADVPPDAVPASLSQPLASPPPPPSILQASASHTATAMELASLDVAADNTKVSAAVASAQMGNSTPAPQAADVAPAASAESAQVDAGAPPSDVSGAAPNETNTPPEDHQTQQKPGRTGWIYAGQFANGKWSEQGLKLGAELPASGGRYVLTWGATVRDNPPGKKSGSGALGKTIGNLAVGDEVEVVQVKKSGSKGHVWLEVKM
ncbi:hypothetical protein VSS37_20175 [Candidatus Thiothrix sp. Deng01]|uniref:SH3b domain-containing protein n=1 Tax=Candidatus Thiothrix phosphatis TaxID=3112415 RepID=A0ABU6D2J7_9GAMM|nr:hypothetical protein [Candidatus Thiothrix sp. Deng01]MEB4593306.1 hypothetical protein [Candidatus Thiothrix sp. Deng01]